MSDDTTSGKVPWPERVAQMHGLKSAEDWDVEIQGMLLVPLNPGAGIVIRGTKHNYVHNCIAAGDHECYIAKVYRDYRFWTRLRMFLTPKRWERKMRNTPRPPRTSNLISFEKREK